MISFLCSAPEGGGRCSFEPEDGVCGWVVSGSTDSVAWACHPPQTTPLPDRVPLADRTRQGLYGKSDRTHSDTTAHEIFMTHKTLLPLCGVSDG